MFFVTCAATLALAQFSTGDAMSCEFDGDSLAHRQPQRVPRILVVTILLASQSSRAALQLMLLFPAVPWKKEVTRP
jgi:hypothetical protein